MATFYNISANEMRAFLRKDKGWQEEQSLGREKEIVFSYPIKVNPQIQVKVYSGIKIASGVSRGVGCDSIKVCAVDIRNHKGWIKAKRVHRVSNWRDNLKSRVIQVIKQSEARLR